MKKFKIRRPSNLHGHGRDGEMLELMIGRMMKYVLYLLFMPNLLPAIVTADMALRYLDRIMAAAAGRFPHCIPVMTIQITETTTKAIIRTAAKLGIMRAKMYIRGVTTNSQDGVRLERIRSLIPIFKLMAKLRMVLLIHCEVPSNRAYFLEQETQFIRYLVMIRNAVPDLKIVVEHVTSKDMLQYVLDQDPKLVGATLTPPHLVLTTNAILGPKLLPDNFCRPPAKELSDRLSLVWAATNASKLPNIFMGYDDAAHPWWAKHNPEGCAGISSSDCGFETVVEVFEEAGALGKNLEAYASLNGPYFHGLKPPDKTDTITVVKKVWTVPESIDEEHSATLQLNYRGKEVRSVPIKGWSVKGNVLVPELALSVTPFRAGKKVGWQVVS